MIKTNDSMGETPESSQGLGKFIGVGIVILALWSFLSEKPPNKISIAGIKRRKSKRLFYMLDTGKGLTSVSRQDVNNIKESNPNRLHAAWALTADDARALIQAGQGERYTGGPKKLDFAGHLLNCIGWQQVIDKKGKQITRCFIYAPNCKTKACTKQTEELRAKGLKAKAYKKNYPHKKELSGIYTSCQKYYRAIDEKIRCAKYALNCNSEVECAIHKAAIPWKQSETEYTDKAIKSVAKMLANEMNQSIDDTKRVMRRIKYHGGIAPYSGGYLQEEYRSIPSKYKSKEGIKLDELAQEMEMNESELVEAIGKAEEARARLPRGKRRFAVKDLMFEAESYLAKQESGLGVKSIGQMKRDLSTTQERQLLSWHAKHDFEYPTTNLRETMRVLIDNGYLKEQGKELIVTTKGEEYLDKHSFDIISAGKPTKSKEMTPKEKAELQKELVRLDTMVKEAKKAEKKIAEKGGQMTLFGIEDVSQENLEKFKKFMSKYNDKTQFLDDYMAYSGGIKIKKAIEFYELEIERAKRNAPLEPEERKRYTRIINDLSALVEAMPPEFDDLTFNAVWSLAKSKEQPKQMTLFGKLTPYYYKNTGSKVFVSDKIKYHHGPAFKRVDRYRMEILDENKEHMGTMSNREIESQLTLSKPAIQSYLFGKLVAKKIAMQA